MFQNAGLVCKNTISILRIRTSRLQQTVKTQVRRRRTRHLTLYSTHTACFRQIGRLLNGLVQILGQIW